jgi:hypothetical protein
MPRKEDNEGYIRFPDAATKARVWQKLNEYKGLHQSLKQATVYLPEALERALDVAIAQAKRDVAAQI